MWYKFSKKHWGFHLILDMSEMNDNIKDKDVLKDFVKDLVETINMKAMGPTRIMRLENNMPNAGYDVMQFIETSSITLHLVDRDHTGYLDIFSCKEFDPDKAIDCVKKWFGDINYKKKFIFRDAPV